MKDNGEFTTITLAEGTNTIACAVLHPDSRGGAVRMAVAPFAEHLSIGWALISAASALQLPPDIQVRLLVLVEMLNNYAVSDESTGDSDIDDDPSIPF